MQTCGLLFQTVRQYANDTLDLVLSKALWKVQCGQHKSRVDDFENYDVASRCTTH